MSVVKPGRRSSTILMPVRVLPSRRTNRSAMPPPAKTARTARRCPAEEPGDDGRHAERGEDGGDVDALAARRQLVALDPVDLAGAEPGHPDRVVERRVGGDRDHRGAVLTASTERPDLGARSRTPAPARPAPAAPRSPTDRRWAFTAATAGTLTDSSRTPSPVRIERPLGLAGHAAAHADPDAGLVGGVDGLLDHAQHGRVQGVGLLGERRVQPVHGQHVLRQVVGADRRRTAPAGPARAPGRPPTGTSIMIPTSTGRRRPRRGPARRARAPPRGPRGGRSSGT